MEGKAGRERNGTGFIGCKAPHWVWFGHGESSSCRWNLQKLYLFWEVGERGKDISRIIFTLDSIFFFFSLLSLTLDVL